MENGNLRDTSALIALFIFIVPLILWYLCYLWISTKNWLNNADNLGTDERYLSKYAYNKESKIERFLKKNKQVERERPPNASFFCRINGKETKIEGPYEEQFLTKIEKIKWESKKRRRKNKKLEE